MAGRLLDPLADARGVDEAPGAAAELDQLVDRVDGGAGDVVDDDPLLPGQPVEQRGLADVRLADDRDPARAADLGVALGRRLGQRGEDGVEHVARAAAVQRGDRRTARPARGSTGRRPRPRCAGRRPCWRRARPACRTARRILTTASSASVMPTVASTTNSTASASATAISAWARDPLGQAAGVGVPAAGVDDGEGAAVPVGVVGDPVAGHAGDVLDDRLAAADDPVDQRRLADVGPADDGEDRHRAGGSAVRGLGVVRRGASARSWCSLVGDPGGGVGSRPSLAGSGPGRSRPVVARAWSRWASMCSRSNNEACSTCSRVRGHGVGVDWHGVAEDHVDRSPPSAAASCCRRRARGCRA